MFEVRLFSSVGSQTCHKIGPGNPEGQEEPDHIVDDLDPAEDGEAREEAHRASNEAQLGLSCHLHECVFASIQKSEKISCFHLDVPFNLVVGCCVKEDVDSLQWSMLNCGS